MWNTISRLVTPLLGCFPHVFSTLFLPFYGVRAYTRNFTPLPAAVRQVTSKILSLA